MKISARQELKLLENFHKVMRVVIFLGWYFSLVVAFWERSIGIPWIFIFIFSLFFSIEDNSYYVSKMELEEKIRTDST